MMGSYKSDVPNVIIRDAWERSGMTMYELAKRLGKFRTMKGKRVPDIVACQRTLGLKPYKKPHKQWFTTHMRLRTAIMYAEALELDPVDLGL